jgi:hypothetical protein
LQFIRPVEKEEEEGEEEEKEVVPANPYLRKKKKQELGLATALLLVNREIHKEARYELYTGNEFLLDLNTGAYALSKLRQQIRTLLKRARISITRMWIMGGASELQQMLRVGLRYCFGLKKLTLLGHEGNPYEFRADTFHALRYLPQGCKVVLESTGVTDTGRDDQWGSKEGEIFKKVIENEGRLLAELDKVSCAAVWF